MRLVLLLLVVLALGEGSAPAATVSMSVRTEYDSHGDTTFGDLRLSAAQGEANDIRIVHESSSALIVADIVPLTTRNGCRHVEGDPRRARCEVAGQIGGGDVDLGDENDRFSDDQAGISVSGGPGDDDVEVGPTCTSGSGGFPDSGVLDGGPGDDRLVGGRVFRGGPGADVLAACGGGTVDYSDHQAPVRVDLREPIAGADGEGDRISGMVGVHGGAGDDVLTGTDGDDVMFGGAGADRLDGGRGDDELTGGAGADVLVGGLGRDVLEAATSSFPSDGVVEPVGPDAAANVLDGGPGIDGLEGSSGPDVLDGGPDRDRFEGGGGDDELRADDGVLELLGCGRRGAGGTARVDDLDLVRHCGRVERRGPVRPRVLVLGQSDVERDGLLNVGVACSQDQPGGCRVLLRVKRRGRVVVTRRTVIAPGTSKLVRPYVPGAPSTTGPCLRQRLMLELVARDSAGHLGRAAFPTALGSLSLRCGFGSLLLFGPAGGW